MCEVKQHESAGRLMEAIGPAATNRDVLLDYTEDGLATARWLDGDGGWRVVRDLGDGDLMHSREPIALPAAA